MENCDQRVIIFFALCPLSNAIIRGVIRVKKEGVGNYKGTGRNEQKNDNALRDGCFG